MDDTKFSYRFEEHFPEGFFNKEVNEPFLQKVMSAVLDGEKWTPGNPDKFEPDYFCGDVPFEFTLASNSKKKNNLIQRLQRGDYSSEDLEREVTSYIEERVEDKAHRNYSVSNVHLCVLCVLDLFNWVSDEYGSVTHIITDYPRQQLFKRLKEQYIDTGIFSNIFLVFPDICAKWWVWDVLSGKKAAVQLTDEQIESGDYPYVRITELEKPDESV